MLIQPVQSKEAVTGEKSVSISASPVFHCFFSLKSLWVYALAANCSSFMIGFQRPVQVPAHTFKLDSFPQLHLHLHLSASGWCSALHVCDEIDFPDLLNPFLPWFQPHNPVPSWAELLVTCFSSSDTRQTSCHSLTKPSIRPMSEEAHQQQDLPHSMS